MCNCFCFVLLFAPRESEFSHKRSHINVGEGAGEIKRTFQNNWKNRFCIVYFGEIIVLNVIATYLKYFATQGNNISPVPEFRVWNE